MPSLKNIKNIIAGSERRALGAALLILLMLAIAGYALISLNTFAIYDKGETKIVHTFSDDSADALHKAGIELYENDKLQGPGTSEGGFAYLKIVRAIPITVTADGETTETYSYEGETVNDIIKRLGIAVANMDEILPDGEKIITDKMDIRVMRVTSEIVETIEGIEFEHISRPSQLINAGDSTIIQSGKTGTKSTISEVYKRDGVEIYRAVLEEKVTEVPVPEIAEYGTGGVVTTKDGRQLRFKRYIDVKATAYSTEGLSNKMTAIGTKARVGAIAVDKSVIPLGTRVYVASRDGKSWVYGTAVAEDTGVKGKWVDLFFNTQKECRIFGVKNARVYILE